MAGGVLNKIEHALHLDDRTRDLDTVHASTHVARDQHEAEERRADALMIERDAEQRAHPETSGPPGTVPLAAQHDNLSSMPHRASLDEAAHGDHAHQHHAERQTTPDMEGVAHVPEKDLPQRYDRMEGTGLRPSDPNDVHSMDGKPLPLGASAGDDAML
ncbi:hypothetical protein BMF94_3957 [Rhodotorula taiwanensis]|uniref:Uncharacterized protein n=1 Tax=Rhodotorula taiwanensis TaxID=741276 RepID=A0A2S5B8C6_9BASI|nr:hypothetical protein BMF94_3957 [Rhodotorula taiwanensis]